MEKTPPKPGIKILRLIVSEKYLQPLINKLTIMPVRRIGSIDVIRALTMYLMVFVNDLWTDKNIPQWLEHAPGKADAMGFADIIFPAFLFIVGLSIPYSQQSRLDRGQSRPLIFRHIVLRSIALIVMGFFQMNLENYSSQALLPESVWEILITASFFLMWLDYPKEKQKLKLWLQSLGIAILILMAIIYKGDSPHGIIWLKPHWWGILGLIGWAYFACATITLFSGERLLLLLAFLIFFVFFNSSVMLDWPEFTSSFRHLIGTFGLGNASDSSVTMIGVIAAVMYRKFQEKPMKLEIILVLMAIAFFIFGFATRPLWGISKIRATPSWTTICSAISILSFALLIFLVDRKGKENWFKIIKPAGTSTLTCYLLPYFYYAVFITLIGIRLPLMMRTGPAGIIKSLLFALLIVLITGLLEKKHLRLKI
jgi:heparan-alpha-glucosaminide N-acetyltransferase